MMALESFFNDDPLTMIVLFNYDAQRASEDNPPGLERAEYAHSIADGPNIWRTEVKSCI